MSRKNDWRKRAKEKRQPFEYEPSSDEVREHEICLRNNRNLADYYSKRRAR